jgi:hypothetical protein
MPSKESHNRAFRAFVNRVGVSALSAAARDYWDDIKNRQDEEEAAMRAGGRMAASALRAGAAAVGEAAAGVGTALIAAEVVIPAAGSALLLGIAGGPQWKPERQQQPGPKTQMWQPPST